MLSARCVLLQCFTMLYNDSILYNTAARWRCQVELSTVRAARGVGGRRHDLGLESCDTLPLTTYLPRTYLSRVHLVTLIPYILFDHPHTPTRHTVCVSLSLGRVMALATQPVRPSALRLEALHTDVLRHVTRSLAPNDMCVGSGVSLLGRLPASPPSHLPPPVRLPPLSRFHVFMSLQPRARQHQPRHAQGGRQAVPRRDHQAVRGRRHPHPPAGRVDQARQR